VKLYRYFVKQSVSFAAITLCVASQRVFIVVVVYFVIDSVRKLLDTPSYFHLKNTGMKGISNLETQSPFSRMRWIQHLARAGEINAYHILNFCSKSEVIPDQMGNYQLINNSTP
jgi:hypothetical protein